MILASVILVLFGGLFVAMACAPMAIEHVEQDAKIASRVAPAVPVTIDVARLRADQQGQQAA